MKREEFFELLEDVDGEMLGEASVPQRRKKPIKWFVLGAAASLLFILGVFWGNSGVENSGVTIRNVPDAVSFPISEGELIYLTEEEIFTHWEHVIFKGTVRNIQNIEIDFSGDKAYRALAEIEVLEVFHGKSIAGETVTVLLPCPISNGVWVEDTDVIANLEVGMTGIFMPMVYDEEAYWEQNGATLMLRELAEFGFPDGRRYAFLETDGGVLYAKEAFPSLLNGNTLDDVKAYILDMIQQHLK